MLVYLSILCRLCSGKKMCQGSPEVHSQGCLDPLLQTNIIFRSFSSSRYATQGHHAFPLMYPHICRGTVSTIYKCPARTPFLLQNKVSWIPHGLSWVPHICPIQQVGIVCPFAGTPSASAEPCRPPFLPILLPDPIPPTGPAMSAASPGSPRG